ncbi:MAG: GLPGLI family protein [Bacteroidales bacterium]|nr:GLPGLI family protein [Bacteroidales bacterium MB20-C3-3]
MKRILFTLILFFHCIYIYSQPTVLDTALMKLRYRYIYTRNSLMKERREALMILLIGDKWSLFYNKHNDDLQYGNSKIDRSKYVTTTIDENGKVTRWRSADAPRIIGPTEYTYLGKINVEEIFITNVWFSGLYYYTDKYLSPKWEVFKDKKTIMGYMCQRAESSYFGRKWTAWFTTEIPVDSGPWKLTGLPGLILEASDEDGDFGFIAVSIEPPAEEDVISMKDSLMLTKVTKDALFKLQKKIYENTNGDFGPIQIKTSSPIPKRKLNTIER